MTTAKSPVHNTVLLLSSQSCHDTRPGGLRSRAIPARRWGHGCPSATCCWCKGHPTRSPLFWCGGRFAVSHCFTILPCRTNRIAPFQELEAGQR